MDMEEKISNIWGKELTPEELKVLHKKIDQAQDDPLEDDPELDRVLLAQLAELEEAERRREEFNRMTDEEVGKILDSEKVFSKEEAQNREETPTPDLNRRIEAVEAAPPERRIGMARELFLDIKDLDTLAKDTALKRLSRSLGVGKKILGQEIEMAQSGETADPATLRAGEDFARALGEDVLDKVAETIHALGVVGESRLIKLAYLAVTSRRLLKPVSLVVKGVSSGGKSWTIETVIKILPPSAYIARTGLSPHALAYSEEDFQHRTLIIFEVEGLASDEGSYLLRTLLSEGRLVYETVESTETGLRAKVIEKEGPTNVILTTTRVGLHPENENRLISVGVDDSRAQTAAVLRGTAAEKAREVDAAGWRAYQEWLAFQPAEVSIPYAGILAEMIPPVDVRLRRDFNQILSLIKASAILHQLYRHRDDKGRIVASLEDYRHIRDLVVDLISAQVGEAVKSTIRDTVAAVGELLKDGRSHAFLKEVAAMLDLGKNATARRVRECLSLGYLVDHAEGRKGKARELSLGDPLPEDEEILPTLEALEEKNNISPQSGLVHWDTPAQGAKIIGTPIGTGLVHSQTDEGEVYHRTNTVPTTVPMENGPLPGVSHCTNGDGGGTPPLFDLEEDVKEADEEGRTSWL